MLKARRLSVIVAATTITVHTLAPQASAQTGNVVIQWNQMLQTFFPAGGPGIHIRAWPMLHIAMFDAINSIEDMYTPYLGQVKASHGASAEVAAATAARDILAAIYTAPADVQRFDNLLSEQLKGIPRGLARQGQAVGHAAAAAVLSWRQNDGWPATQAAAAAPDPTYVLPTFPGLWQPTPPANSFATFTFFPRVKPFAMLTSTQFLPPPPPTLISARYATDFNEVKLRGQDCVDRTPVELARQRKL